MMITEPEFDRLTWEPLDASQTAPEAFDRMAEGCTVTGAEPIEWPINTGVLPHLQRPTGERFTLEIEAVNGDTLVFRHGVDLASKGEATA